ncbi:MAG: ribosome assembly RNA-binding protein YhbY [Clostridia bacterium]|nr:ribosome assembly RNA-binding protein YhbY [Clostridia bacterium]
MLNSRQRAQLRGMANDFETILQVGKMGISENTVKQVDDALEARELIKMSVLETSPLTSREAADELAKKVKADVVQVIGRKFILYRQSKEKLIKLVK